MLTCPPTWVAVMSATCATESELFCAGTSRSALPFFHKHDGGVVAVASVWPPRVTAAVGSGGERCGGGGSAGGWPAKLTGGSIAPGGGGPLRVSVKGFMRTAPSLLHSSDKVVYVSVPLKKPSG